MFNQPLNRGTSILAALVFAAILGGIAVTVDSLSPSSLTASRTQQLAQTTAATEKEQSGNILCSAVRAKSTVEIEEDSDAPEQACICKETKGGVTKYYNIDYTVKAELSKGDAVAKTTRKVGGEVVSFNNCTIKYCAPNGDEKSCKTISAQDSASLTKNFNEKREAVVQSYDKDVANIAARGGLDSLKLGPLSDERKQGIADAFKEVKADLEANRGGTAGTLCYEWSSYFCAVTDAQKNGLKDAAAQIDALATCKDASCEAQTPKPEVKDPTVLNPDTKTPVYQGPCPDGKPVSADGKCSTSAPQQPKVCPSGYSGTFPNCTPPYNGNGGLGGGNGTGGGGSGQGSGSGNNSFLQGLMASLAKGLGMQQQQQPLQQTPQQCATDQNAYQQQQQQYQYQMQQYQYQLQLYQQQQYQQQLQQMQSGGGYGLGGYYQQPQMPQQPQQCTPSTQNQCQQIPLPNPAGCTVGAWQPQYNGACIVQWHCVPKPGGTGDPEAKISCQPQIADVGMTVAITFSCANSKTSKGEGFSTGDKLSGATTTEITSAAKNGEEKVFQLTCANAEEKTSSAQCKVQVVKTSIVLVSNPQSVVSGEAASIGWVTTGMKSCIVSSPDLPDFTSKNAANTSVNGMASTGPITSDSTIDLKCETAAGSTKTATTVIRLK